MSMQSGWGGCDESKKRSKQEKADGVYPPQRVFLAYGESRRLTFLDDDQAETTLEYEGERLTLQLPYIYREVKIRGERFPKFFTEPDEPCCVPKTDFRDVVVFTVVDHSIYKGANRTYKNEKKFLVAQVWMPIVSMIRKFAETNEGGLRGLTLEIQRSDNQTAPGVGDMVFPTRQEYPDGLPATVKNGGGHDENTQHANYLKWLSAKTPAAIAAELGHGQPAQRAQAPAQAPAPSNTPLAPLEDNSIPY